MGNIFRTIRNLPVVQTAPKLYEVPLNLGSYLDKQS